MPLNHWITSMLALAVAALALPAAAERADRDKAVNLEADKATVDDSTKTATFTGNVVLTQGTLSIRADRMVVKQDADGFQSGSAWGNPVSLKQKREGVDEYVEGWGQRLEYDGKADRVQLFENARLRRGQDEVRGNYISYDSRTEFFQVTGGGAAAATADNPKGRVRAVIQPKKKQPEAGGPAAETQAPPAR